MHHSCSAINTNQRFELELAINDWHAASQMKSECLQSVSRIVGCSEEDAIEICDSHESAQTVLDRLGIEVFSSAECQSSEFQCSTKKSDDAVDELSDVVKQAEADLMRIQRRLRSVSDVAYGILEIGIVVGVGALTAAAFWVMR